MAKTRRKPLSRERILETALALADEQGIDALSMRKLGQQLGYEAMSLYNHVANKDDLLDGMVDLVLAEMEAPARREGSPDSQGGDLGARVLRRHPWAAASDDAGASAPPARVHGRLLGALRGAGFSPRRRTTPTT